MSATPSGGHVGGWTALVALGALAMPLVAHAAPVCSAVRHLPPVLAAPTAQPRRWPAPLDRTVWTDGRDLSLREALDRLSAAARFRLSYTAELLPLDRRVCGTFEGVPAGDALAALLGATGLEAVVAGSDQIVLVPARAAVDSAAPAARSAPRPTPLEAVVVTGHPGAAAPRARPVALDVVAGRQVAERGATTLAAALDVAVPGVWMWTPSPSALLARYGSIRGASSFGVSAPKIYLDGVEVANPLLLTALSPESIDHIEVIRGPQGAALYGADAISGVVDIVTRHDGTGADGARVELRSDAGVSRSDYAPIDVFAQRHALSVRAGTAERSGGFGVSLGTLGDFVPNGGSRELAAHGDARLVGSRASLTLTGRLLDKTAGATPSPLLPAATAPPTSSTSSTSAWGAAQSMRQYTLGAAAVLAQGGRWTHRAVAGVDGYRLSDGAPAVAALLASASDSALRAARGGADRATLRVSSVARFGDDDRRGATLTLAADHSQLREATLVERSALGTSPDVELSWRNSTGLVAQGDVALGGTLFLDGGVRVERDAGYTQLSDVALLPSIGAAFVRRAGGAVLTLRGAYGKGIRPPRVAGLGLRSAAGVRVLVPSDLGAETQAGTEAGADLTLGAFAVRVTRFDQRASGLIQAVAADTWPTRPATPRTVLQNVGEIANRGWELQGTAQTGRLALAGALSLVDSRVAHTTTGYTGDLRDGDRMLEVPARTASLTATWTVPRWSASLGVARASDWIGYDRLALARDLAGTGGSTLADGRLRDYWRTYGGVTRLRASAERDLRHGLSLLVTGDNLLGGQSGEPDDVTVVPGRTLTLGMRARF